MLAACKLVHRHEHAAALGSSLVPSALGKSGQIWDELCLAARDSTRAQTSCHAQVLSLNPCHKSTPQKWGLFLGGELSCPPLTWPAAVPPGSRRSYLSPPQVLMLAAESAYPRTWP